MLGLKILRIGDLNGWYPVKVNAGEYVSVETCPSDNSPFYPVAAITCGDTDDAIRLGVCPTCSLIGYMDRPSDEAIDHYYAATWMGQSQGEADAIARKVASSKSADAYGDIDVDRRLPAVDFGCGYGNGITQLLACGFRDIHATESCPVRANAVAKVFGVTCGELPPRCGLIRSSHVFEHLADPLGTLRTFADHQEPGDKLLLWMPDFWNEPTMGVLMFWPHLWSFTHGALDRMAAVAGYKRVREVTGSPADVCVLYERGKANELTYPHQVSSVAWKLMAGLGMRSFTEFTLGWQRYGEGCQIEQAEYRNVKAFAEHSRSIVCSSLDKFKSDSLIEIQWASELTMFQK